MRSPELNIAVLAAQKDRRGCRAASLALSGHARTRAGSRNASTSRLLDWRRFGCRRWRRAVERHPIDDRQHGKPNFPVLAVGVAVLLEQHDRRDLAVMLTAVEPVTDLINHCDDGFDGAVGRRLEDHLDASIGAVGAFHVDSPFLLPRKSCVRHFRDHRFRLADRNEALVDHLVAVEADSAPLERQRIDGPSAVCLGDGASLPKSPSAAVFSTLEQHHRQTSAADDGCRVDVGERCLERRQGGERTSCWRGGDLLASGPFVFAIVVSVIAVAIMFVVVVAHNCLPPWKASSASENVRASSSRPRTGTRTFSDRTSDTPERFEMINSGGILRPRAFALSSSCFGVRIVSASIISSWSKPRLSRATCATISSRQRRSARPAESAYPGTLSPCSSARLAWSWSAVRMSLIASTRSRPAASACR